MSLREYILREHLRTSYRVGAWFIAISFYLGLLAGQLHLPWWAWAALGVPHVTWLTVRLWRS